MRSFLALASSLILVPGALAQYGNYGSGSSYGSDSGSYGSGSGSTGSSEAESDTSNSVIPEAAVASSSPSTGLSAPAGMVDVHIVKVSNKKGSLVFEPNNLKAEPGSMVQFHFYPKVCQDMF